MENLSSNKCFQSINNVIEFGKCEALNSENNESLKYLFSGGSIKSNKGDPEMILSITFKEKVSLTCILLESSNKDNVPSCIKLYANKSNLDFGDIDSVPFTEELKKYTSGKQYPLKIAKFRNLDTLSIYVSNNSGDIVELNNLIIYGTTAENTDMSQMKNTNP